MNLHMPGDPFQCHNVQIHDMWELFTFFINNTVSRHNDVLLWYLYENIKFCNDSEASLPRQYHYRACVKSFRSHYYRRQSQGLPLVRPLLLIAALMI